MISSKLFFSLVIGSSLLLAQQRNTVYTTLVTAITTVTPSTYLIQNNIGQTFHAVSAIVVDTAGVGSCGAQVGSVNLSAGLAGGLEASFNGLNYFQLPQKVSVNLDVNNFTQSKIYHAITAYPFIRFRIQQANLSFPSGCGLSLFYSGSLSSSGLNDSVYTSGNSTLNLYQKPVTTSCTDSIPAMTGTAFTSIGLTGVIFVNPSTSVNTVNFWSDVNCTLKLYSFTIPASSTITINPDLFPDNLFIFTATVGVYTTATAAMTVTPYLQFLN